MIAFLLIRIDKGIDTSYIFRAFLLVSFFLWYVLPFFLSIIGYWGIIELITDTSFDEYLKLNCFEVWFYAIILFVFTFSKRFISTNNNTFFVDNPNANSVALPIMLIFTVVMLIYNFIYRFDYSDVNEIENAEGGVFFILNVFNLFIQSYIWICIINREHPHFRKLFIIIILAYLAYYILSGSRIYMLSILWLMFFIKKEHILSHKWLYFIPIASIVAVSLILLPILSSIRSAEEAEQMNDVEQITHAVFDQLNIKLNASGYTTVLITNDGVGFAGTKPYIGSMLKFLPRSIWAEKPTPTSFNGDISGTPARRIPFILTGENSTYNVGTSAGLVSLWHGYYSVVLSILLSVMFLWILCRTLASKSLIVNAIGFMLFYFPQLVMTPATGDNIIQKLFEVAILFGIVYFTGMLRLYKFE
ncbi:MAG: hypothetical protein FWF72_06110 [Paludibacter sp.]|nr:hypothetical protein [Paludibacter sp.]